VPRLLTHRFVESVKPQSKRCEYGDASGGRLLVHPSGAKVWIHRYRDATGKSVKRTLGRAVGKGALTLSAMREAVARDRRRLEQGVDIPRPVLASSDDSVATHAAAFLEKHHAVNSRQSTFRAATAKFNNIVLPAWGNRAVQDIRRRDVIALVEATAAERGPAAAEWLFRGVLSKFFSWLMTRDIIETSPCPGVAGVLPPLAKPRERTLDHHTELLPLRKAAGTDRPVDRAVCVLALCGQRRNEVGGMRWSELEHKTRVWTIPAARTKNGREHRVPLSTQAWRIIDAQPHMVGCDYVFTAFGRGPVTGWGKTKERLSAAAGIEESSWRIHDLRRTCAAGMQKLGVRTEVIERALNHHSGVYRGIIGTYQVDPLEPEVRAALQAWGDYVEGLLSPKARGKRRGARP
jgi:integrase